MRKPWQSRFADFLQLMSQGKPRKARRSMSVTDIVAAERSGTWRSVSDRSRP
jgi:hypothetical protein